jgi:hypothetical protein
MTEIREQRSHLVCRWISHLRKIRCSLLKKCASVLNLKDVEKILDHIQTQRISYGFHSVANLFSRLCYILHLVQKLVLVHFCWLMMVIHLEIYNLDELHTIIIPYGKL